MATIPLYNMEGSELGEMSLSDAVFGVAFNEALVHQALVAEEANLRQGTRNTKVRSDVRGGGRKPWRQKGTGRARQGTIRAPHFKGGGVVFGPHPRDYRKELPVKMRRGAMRCVLSGKVRDGQVIALDNLAINGEKPSTRAAVAILEKLKLADARRVLVITPQNDPQLNLSLRNLPNVMLRFAPNFSVRDAVTARHIVLVAGAEKGIEAVWTPGKQATKEEAAA